MHVEGLRPVDSDVTELLHTEHAVARVLAAAPGEAEAYPELLAAMGEALAWDFGAVWVPGRRRRAAVRGDVAAGRRSSRPRARP